LPALALHFQLDRVSSLGYLLIRAVHDTVVACARFDNIGHRHGIVVVDDRRVVDNQTGTSASRTITTSSELGQPSKKISTHQAYTVAAIQSTHGDSHSSCGDRRLSFRANAGASPKTPVLGLLLSELIWTCPTHDDSLT